MARAISHVSSPALSARWHRVVVLLLGVLLTQAILIGPSLVGRKIMLPVDVLAQPGVYLPRTSEVASVPLHDVVVSDLIHPHEISRRFVHQEIAAGRLPLWLPYQYCGSPNIWPWFSPFLVLASSTASPFVWAWVHLLEAIVMAAGAYLFFRRALGLGFWAAVVPAWCYPLTGFFIFWQGNPTAAAAFWFPWLLLMVDRTVRNSAVRWVGGLALATALVLLGGNLDVAGQCIFAAGLFGVWSVVDYARARGAITRSLVKLAMGGLLGLLLSAPYWWPVLEYSQSGSRMARRGAGEEERPPVGLSALPQTVLPDMNGATRTGSFWLAGGNQVESSAATYAGLVATLFAAPLAWCSRRHRSFNFLAMGMIVLALSWCLNLPGFVTLLRMPLLRMMSHNRLVFVASFFILCQAAIGLHVLRNGEAVRRKWFWVPLLLVAGLGAWSLWRAFLPPEPIATQIDAAVKGGGHAGWVRTVPDVARLQAWFFRAHIAAFLLGASTVVAWIWVLGEKRWSGALTVALASVLVADMVWFAYGRTAQGNPAHYFPRLAFLDELARQPAGRILGFDCLPAPLAAAAGFADVRGYDAVDPSRYVSLLQLAEAAEAPRPSYALTQWFRPRADVELPGRLKLPPVLDLLGVSHLVFRGEPPPQVAPTLRGVDYWALANPSALPRVFVPRRVEIETDDAMRLKKLGAADFDPRALAIVESSLPAGLPMECAGDAVIAGEVPTRVFVSSKMRTAGLIVLADRWDKGWSAYFNGIKTPIVRVNHALRGVFVPPGMASLEFRYEPASFTWGVRLAALSAVVIAAIFFIDWRSPNHRRGKFGPVGASS